MGASLVGTAQGVNDLMQQLVYEPPLDDWYDDYIEEEDFDETDGDLGVIEDLPLVRRARGLDL